MSVYNTASIQYKNHQIEELQNRIRERVKDHQGFSGRVKAGSPANTSPSFSSLLSTISLSLAGIQDRTTAMAAFFKDVQTIIDALQTGDKTTARNIIAPLQTNLNHALPQNPETEMIAADLKSLREALQADDPAAIQAAMIQLQVDCQCLAQTCLQNSQTIFQSAVTGMQAILDSNPESLRAAVETQNGKITGAVNTSLQTFLKVLSSLNASPLIGAGLAGLASFIGTRINTSA